jgi:serine/threonine-protein kinase
MPHEADQGSHRIKPRVIGRYALFGEIAAGGMATVHFGRLVGPAGFSRIVAIKRLYPQYAKDPDFVSLFLEEARLASRIQHPNVVTTLDVVTLADEVFLVMEYVPGESLSRVAANARAAGEPIPPGHVVAIVSGLLHGLHAAHEAKSELRQPLNIVHRDVSPQNVLVGVDGVARVLDFGVAKAAARSGTTRDKQARGKLGYMSPEQLGGKPVDRRTDVFAAGVVLWEVLTGKRLFDGADAGEIFVKVLSADIPEPRSVTSDVPEALNAVVVRALSRDPNSRYQTARDFAVALESSVVPSTPRAVGDWVERHARREIERRAAALAVVEGYRAPPEELAKLEAAASSAVDELVSRPSVSKVQRATTVQVPARLPPPPKPLVPAEGDDALSSVSRASMSALSNLAISQAPPTAPAARSEAGMWFGAAVACALGGALGFVVFTRSPGYARATPDPGAEAVAFSRPPPAAAAEPGAVVAATPSAAPAPSASTGTTAAVRVEDLPKDAPDGGATAARPGLRYLKRPARFVRTFPRR